MREAGGREGGREGGRGRGREGGEGGGRGRDNSADRILNDQTDHPVAVTVYLAATKLQHTTQT